MGKQTLTSVTLDETFNPKDIVISDVEPPKKCGDLVRNPRAAVGHKSMKRVSPVPDQGKYRSPESYMYLILKGKAIGIYQSFEFGQKRIPKNFRGYDLVVPLVSNRESTEPGEDDHIFWALDGMHKRVIKLLIKNKKNLPKQFRNMEDEDLKKCVRPPYTPKYKGKDGKTRSPSLSIPFKYYKADEAKGKKESLLTKCRGPGNKPFHPRDYLSIPGEKTISGDITAAIRLCHLGFSVKVDQESPDGDLKKNINYTLELANLNFTPSRGMEEPDLLGGNYDAEDDNDLYKEEELVDVDEDFGDDEDDE